MGEAHDVRSAVAAAFDLRPDVVLMDLGLPDGSGIEAIREILAGAPGVRVLVMTMSDEDDAVVTAMRAGARGYVVKGAGRADLLTGIRTVAAGGAVFSPGVADRLGLLFGSLGALPGREAFPGLTDREREVLDLVPAATTTGGSPGISSSPTRRCATTSPTSWASSGWRRGPRPPSVGATAASGAEALAVR